MMTAHLHSATPHIPEAAIPGAATNQGILRPGRLRCLGVAALAVAVVPLAGCGSNSSSQSSPAGQATGAGQGGGSGQNGYTRVPGARGTIAEVSGNTVQVQSATAQTAVDLTSSTTFRQLTATTRSALAVGDCVTVTAPRNSASTSPGASASPTSAPASLTAGSVTITAAVNGSCTTDSRRASASPRPSATWSPSANAAGFARMGTTGQVTAVAADSFTVRSMRRSTTTPVTVLTTTSTTYEKQAAATKATVVVGRCMSATGSTDSTGAVTASQVVVSQPVGGSCTTAGGWGRGGQR